MFKNIFIALVVLVAGVSIFLFSYIYKDTKGYEIKQLKEAQTIHAKQSAQGIEDFFASWIRNLESLSKIDAIIDNNNVGKRYLNLFYEANKEQITSITRLDEKGVILYNFPANSSEGMDVSGQEHVRMLLQDHEPVISDVFRAVEGFDSIAIHVPVFRGGRIQRIHRNTYKF